NIFAANGAHLAFRGLQQVAPAKTDEPANMRASRIQQVESCHAKRALSRSAAAREAQDFTALKFKGDIAQHRRIASVCNRELQREQRRHFAALSMRIARRSAFQYVCGRSTTGVAFAMVGRIAD